jgi:lipopolysaccharide transport protein LptA
MAATSTPATSRLPSDLGESVTIEADSLERVDGGRVIVFIGPVHVEWQRAWRLQADRVEVYLDDAPSARITRATATGNVRVVTRDCRIGQADRAEYRDDDERLRLSGNVRISLERKVVSGDELVLAVSRVFSFGGCA